MLVQFRCPGCRSPISVSTRRTGVPIRCPACKGEMIVPSASDPPAPSEPLPVAPPAVDTKTAGTPDRPPAPHALVPDLIGLPESADEPLVVEAPGPRSRD